MAVAASICEETGSTFVDISLDDLSRHLLVKTLVAELLYSDT